MDFEDYNYNINTNLSNKNKPTFGLGVFVGVVAGVAIMFTLILMYFKVTGNKISSGNFNYFGSSVAGSSNMEKLLTDDELAKLEAISQWVENNSYYEFDNEAFVNGIFESYLSSLEGDEYTAYYDREAFESLMKNTEGTYSGIGCVVTQNAENGYVTVVKPYVGSPAYEAGIAIGDIILSANGVEITGMDLNEAVTYLLGEEGTTVSVTYVHDGEEITTDIVRKSIEIPTVEYEMLEDSIGYIEISSFDEKTVQQFEKAINELTNQGVKGLIFDVRSNPGGLYTTVCSMLDTLLPEGVIVYTEDKAGNKEYEESDASEIDLPMAVIINGNSASASEIFAGALQDYDKAEIIGTQSFGKGIVQSVIPLGDGTGIKFTISAYFTPKGVCIHGVGITPDQVVEIPVTDEAYDENGYLLDEYDTQLNAAKEYIKEQIK